MPRTSPAASAGRWAAFRRLTLALAAVVLLSGVALAQPGAAAVRGAARTYSEAEVLAFARLQDVTKTVRWGRLVPYAGAAVAAGSLIYAALDWFYQEAQRATGTSLDEWSEGVATGAIAITAGARLLYAGESYASYGTAWWFYKPGGVLQSGGEASHNVPFKLSITESDRLEVFNDAYAQWCAFYCADGWFAVPNSYLTTGEVIGQSSCGVVVIGANTTARCYLVKTRQDLGDWIDNHPDAGPAARGILNDYLQHQGQQPWWPYTYAEPYGPGIGFEVDPVPNINQWYDNPYANPEVDTDNDGWPDWKEILVGTDPLDPSDRPVVDPTDPGEGQDPLPDVDGDGIPDKYDPCPYQASNKCADQAEPEDPIEIPDDYAREVTAQEQLGVLQDILAELREDEDEGTVVPGEFAGADPELDDWTPWELTSSVWVDAQTVVETQIQTLRDTLSARQPFGYLSWFPSSASVGSGDACAAVSVPLGGEDRSINICDNPLDEFMHTVGRSALLALAVLSFSLTVVRRVQQS